MRSRLLPLLIILIAGVVVALGIPLAISEAAREQQRVVVDRIDDTARFASLAQYVTDPVPGGGDDGKLATLRQELERYHEVYGIRAGVFLRDGTPLAAQKLERVLRNDPGMGVIRHVDAGYDLAAQVAEERGVRVPMLEG